MIQPAPVPSFESLGLSAETLRVLAQERFLHPTPIQARAIPPALAGKDVIGCAATGTGKTAAFALPLLEKLSGASGLKALVLAPTRELAVQIAGEVNRFGRARKIRTATLIGGVGMGGQLKALAGSPQLVIATPGRLIDHLEQGSLKLSGVAFLVLDEADRMLDMGFKPQLTRILERVPRARQTLLFSATMGAEVTDFTRAHLKDPVRVEVTRSGTTAARAEQRAYLVEQNEKLPLLLALLDEDPASTLVFTRTKRRADRVARSLQRAGHSVARIHADRSQNQRQQALEGFRRGQYRVLVATDIAARGLDVADIGHVVNYDLPHLAEDYVHRVGRTARAAASGKASAFVAPEERGLLAAIERLVSTPLARADVPRGSPLFQAELQAAAARQAHPGPPQPKPPRQRGPPRGRHARTHRRR